jgi:hypothetical protein
MILVCRFDCDNDCDNQKGENACSDSECLTLIDLATGETADRSGPRHDCSASLPLVEKVMQVLRFASTSPGHDPIPAQFLAFLLSICYNVGTSRDFDPEEDWDGILGNVEVKKEIDFLCPDQAERHRLALVLAFLAGHESRLGKASEVSFLPGNPALSPPSPRSLCHTHTHLYFFHFSSSFSFYCLI